MGNSQTKNEWKPCSIETEYGFRHEPSYMIGLNLNPLWDSLPSSSKYAVTRDEYLKAELHIQTLYRNGLAFLVRRDGEQTYYTSNTVHLNDTQNFSFIMIACTFGTVHQLLNKSALKDARNVLSTKYELNTFPIPGSVTTSLFDSPPPEPCHDP